MVETIVDSDSDSKCKYLQKVLKVRLGKISPGWVNSLLPVGSYVYQHGPLPVRIAYILDLVHLVWTILVLLHFWLRKPHQYFDPITNNQ